MQVPPHTFGMPLPPQVVPSGHSPQLIEAPQPSPMSPHCALALWQNQTYAQFAAGLFPGGQIVAGGQRSSAAAALQASFADVLDGMAPEQAADEAIASLDE